MEMAPDGRGDRRRGRWPRCAGARPRQRPGRVVVVTAGTADLPVADECVAVLRAFGFRPDAGGRLRRGRRAPPAGVGRRAGRRRRRRGGGRDGGGPGQPGGGITGARSWPCPCRPATAPPSKASPPCWPCTRRAPPGSPWSGSTTASVPPAPWPGCCREPGSGVGTRVGPDVRRLRSRAVDGGLVPLLRRHRRRHGARQPARRRRRLSTRCSACWSACLSAVGGFGPSPCCGPASPPPRPWSRPPTTSWCGPTPTSSGWSRRPASPTGWPGAPWPPSRRWPRSRAGSTAGRPTRCTSTRSGRTTPIIDVVGTAAALEVLGVDEVTSRRWPRDGHGPHAPTVPAQSLAGRGPAAAGASRPGVGTSAVELTTPTGAAILAAMAIGFGPLPPMVIAATGFGAGSHEIDGLPNCTQVVVGERLVAARRPGQPVMLLETNLDDATGETLAHAVEALLDGRGPRRLDHPGHHEEGRPGHTVSVAGRSGAGERRARHARRPRPGASACGAALLERWPAARAMDEVEVDGARRPGQGQPRAGEGRAARRGAGGVAPRCSVARRAAPRRDGMAATRSRAPRPGAGAAPAPSRRAPHRRSASTASTDRQRRRPSLP